MDLATRTNPLYSPATWEQFGIRLGDRPRMPVFERPLSELIAAVRADPSFETPLHLGSVAQDRRPWSLFNDDQELIGRQLGLPSREVTLHAPALLTMPAFSVLKIIPDPQSGLPGIVHNDVTFRGAYLASELRFQIELPFLQSLGIRFGDDVDYDFAIRLGAYLMGSSYKAGAEIELPTHSLTFNPTQPALQNDPSFPVIRFGWERPMHLAFSSSPPITITIKSEARNAQYALPERAFNFFNHILAELKSRLDIKDWLK